MVERPSAKHEWKLKGFGSIRMIFLYFWKIFFPRSERPPLKGRLPQKLQSKSIISCENVQIHSLFRHGFIKKPKSKFNRNGNRHILFLCDRFRKAVLDTDLIANAFQGSIQNTRLFSIFSSFIFCSIIYQFEKRKGAYSCLPSKDTFNHSLSLFKRWFHLWSFYSV